MLEVILWLFVIWFAHSFISGFIDSYHEVVEEREYEAAKKAFAIQIDVEQINNLWYGWTTDDDNQSHFVGQGVTYQDAIEKCAERIATANPGSKILFKFMVKKHEPDAVQS